MNKTLNVAVWIGIGLVIALIGLIIFRVFWVTSQEKHEFAYSFDRFSGNIETYTNCGWIVKTPIRYSVHTIDLRPVQLTISANSRVLNAKLVRFDPKGLKTFIEWHGRGAESNMNGGFTEILKCYAFDRENGRDCPFLEVIQEIAPNQGVIQNETSTKNPQK
jgi:hypothetical protein